MVQKRGCQWIALLLSIAMTLCICAKLPVNAVYENTYTNVGDQVEDLIQVAETQLGYSPESAAKYNLWNGMVANSYNYAWCHTFVSWCADQAGIGTEIIPKTESVTAGVGFFDKNKRWLKSESQGGDYVPRRGDIVYFSRTGNIENVTHVGIVTGTEDHTLYTVEGNVSNLVLERSYDLSSSNILGYGCPLYVNYPNLIMPDAPEVTVIAGSSEKDTIILWTNIEMAATYTVTVWNEANQEQVMSASTGNCSIGIALDAGRYAAQIVALNGENAAYSEEISFEVYTQPTAVSDLRVLPGDGITPTKFFWTPSVAESTKLWVCGMDVDGNGINQTIEVGDAASYEIQLSPGAYGVTIISKNNQFSADVGMEFKVKSISAADVVLLQQYLLGIRDLSELQVFLADMNEDEYLNGIDLALLRQKVVNRG